jgi:hypothetical protein
MNFNDNEDRKARPPTLSVCAGNHELSSGYGLNASSDNRKNNPAVHDDTASGSLAVLAQLLKDAAAAGVMSHADTFTLCVDGCTLWLQCQRVLVTYAVLCALPCFHFEV